MNMFGFETEVLDGEPVMIQFASSSNPEVFTVSRKTILPTFLEFLLRNGSDRDENVLWAPWLEFDFGVTFIELLPVVWPSTTTHLKRALHDGTTLEVSLYNTPTLHVRITICGRRWLLLDTKSFFALSLEKACELLKLLVKNQRRSSYLGERLPSARERSAFESHPLVDAQAAYELGKFLAQWLGLRDGPCCECPLFGTPFIPDDVWPEL